MIIVIELLCIVALGLYLSRTWLEKPYYEDDGNWFYYAVFRNKGPKINRPGHSVPGHFGVHWLALQFARLFDDDSPRFFYALKAAWLAATSLAVYWVLFLFTQDTLVAFLGGVFFTLVWTTPNTLYMLTYAEHFFLLPLLCALGAMTLGVQGGHWLWFVLAGVFTGWTTQFKITNLPVLGLLPLGLFWAQTPWTGLAFYSVGGAAQILLPLAVVPSAKRGGPAQNVLQMSYRPLIAYVNLLAKKYKVLHSLSERLWKAGNVNTFSKTEYVETVRKMHDQKTIIQKLEQVGHCVRDLLPLLVLAVAGVAMMPWHFEPVVVVALVLAAYYLFVQQLQQNYFTPHFSPVWVGVAMAAAAAAGQVLNGGRTDAGSMTVYVLLAALVCRMAYVHYQDRQPGREDMVGHCPPDKAHFMRVAQAVGEFVRDNSEEHERVLVWGNHPAVYLYARRQCVKMMHLFTYGHGTSVRHEDDLFKTLQASPPEWIVHYNNVVPENWDIDNIAGRTGVRYDLKQRIQIKDSRGRVVRAYTGMPFDYPIYRRNDAHYLLMLRERALAALDTGDAEACRFYLDRALSLAPDDVEAGLLDELAATPADDRRGMLQERLAAAKEPAVKDVLLRLLAGEMRRVGEVRPCLAMLTKSVSQGRSGPATMRLLGELLVDLGEVAQGAQMLNEVMRTYPHSPLVMIPLAKALIALKQPDDAAELQRRAEILVNNDLMLARVL